MQAQKVRATSIGVRINALREGHMRYIFMDNFRGFSETILPLKQITFLVGENSTGKSSFLKLLHMLSRPGFWFAPGYSFQEEAELGGFDDVVSAWSTDKSFFRAGVLSARKEKTGVLSCAFTVHTFGNRDGTPYVSRYIHFTDGLITKLEFQRKKTKYKTANLSGSFTSEDDLLQFFLSVVREDRGDVEGFKDFPQDFPQDAPLPYAISMLRRIEKGKALSSVEFIADIPFQLDLTWIAPIRTRPQRFYDSTKKSFSPEGDHTPFLLQKTLRTKAKSAEFAEKLKAFGEASGLFETIAAHSFDSSNPQSPFEILVKFSGAGALNINSVGYGVSQVLPLIVEFLSWKKHTFAVQQPEVHLHPRAQAALGDLVAQLAMEKELAFILETHSDYLIDRCRLNLSKRTDYLGAQVLFFERTSSGNKVTILPIDRNGRYPSDQPIEFRDFFIKEEMALLEV
jgi:hypothetical protein